jgi:hypothetical protein
MRQRPFRKGRRRRKAEGDQVHSVPCQLERNVSALEVIRRGTNRRAVTVTITGAQEGEVYEERETERNRKKMAEVPEW